MGDDRGVTGGLPAEKRSLAASRGGRLGFVALGHVSVGLAVVGAVLPVMPTTVFLIAAAGCYARGSDRFHRWLLSTRVAGPVIRDWEAHRAMSRRAKALAIATILATFILTIGFALHVLWARLLLGALGAALITTILAIRTRT